MKLPIVLLAIAALLMVGCNEDSDDENNASDTGQDSETSKEGSVFGGYLVAIDKAKAAGKAANDRQTSMEETLELDSSTENRPTLGMAETSRPTSETYAEEEGLFGDLIMSVNKAKASRGMLNERQRQMDSLLGAGAQSTRESGELADAPTMFAPTAANQEQADGETEDETEGGMFSGIDRARELKDAANARHQELESMSGGQSESTL